MPSSPSPTSPCSAAMLSSPAIDPVAPQQRRLESSNYSPQTLRHPLFYMQDNMIVLEVEGCLFKVHRYQLEWHSDYFCSLFKNQDDIDGHTDQLPLRIPSVTRRAFETLLHFLYFGVYNPENIFLHEWIILLSISTQLQFTKIRRYAIREVSAQQASLDPIKAIVLATNYDVPEWLAPAYAELCQRCRPLDEEEAEQLGARTTAQLCRAREVLREKTFSMFQHRRYGVQYSAPEHYDGELVERVVEDLFRPDSDRMTVKAEIDNRVFNVRVVDV
ncbi:hypothetical protein A0H81_03084 [Grifola frondosa]|uniref:BTB domain-containing protein n=1 Tax=Grifola frondosa TaxID=5627 RepID=A0A1C7MGS6_GRIFR|nr:hypothetical protein A0H81_03084 [Grifola frondosa]